MMNMKQRSSESERQRIGQVCISVFLCVFASWFLSSCVRMAGTAGYWTTNADGESKIKKAGFDTADYVPGSPASGRIATA